MENITGNDVYVNPATSLRMELFKIISKTPEREQAWRIINSLFAYFSEPTDSRLSRAEAQIASLKHTIECRDLEIKKLNKREGVRGKLLEDEKIKHEINSLYHKLGRIMGEIE